jgi:hypothetical protein
MRVPRLILTCLLALGIALQGHAGVVVMDASCSMTHATAGHATVSHADVTHGGHAAADPAHGHHAPADAGTDAAGDGLTPCGCLAGCHLVHSVTVGAVPLLAWLPASQAAAPTAQAFRSRTIVPRLRPPALA